jgi:hypothetical protein
MFHGPSVNKITNLNRKTGLIIAFRPTNTIFQQSTEKPKNNTNEQSKQWMHTLSPKKPKIFKQTLSNKKMMASVFWDRKGIFLTEFMAPGTTKRQRFIVKR